MEKRGDIETALICRTKGWLYGYNDQTLWGRGVDGNVYGSRRTASLAVGTSSVLYHSVLVFIHDRHTN